VAIVGLLVLFWGTIVALWIILGWRTLLQGVCVIWVVIATILAVHDIAKYMRREH
jgi:hypothetical protein